MLATEDLNRTIEQSLELAVSHGKLNDETKVRHVSERDDPTYNYFRKNDNPLDVTYKQQAKFDVHNPIIGSLLKEINRGRQTYEGIKKTLDKGPDPRALDLEERFTKIFERDNKKMTKVSLIGFLVTIEMMTQTMTQTDRQVLQLHLRSLPPEPTNNNLLNELPLLEDPDPLIKLLREHYFPFSNRFEGRDYSLFDDDTDFKVETEYPEKINLDGNLREVFSETDQAFEPESEVYRNENLREFTNQLDRGEIPEEFEFFSGGEQNIGGLYGRISDHNLDEGNQDIIEYLAMEECQDALERDGISIHVLTGNIFVSNENTGESLYTFLNNQQDTAKKEIPLDFIYDDDLTDYMTKYLPVINEFDEVKHDFLTNNKFLFHLFNKYQQDRGKTKYPVRHSTLTDDNYALQTLQNRNWPYFIRRIIEFSQGFINLSELTDSDATEINILNNTRANFEIGNLHD